jgi:2-methylcitrate dehydratase PrpD
VHDQARMDDPAVLALRGRIRIEPRPGAGRREHAVITLTLRDGRTLQRTPQTVRGQPDDPMTTHEVMAKAEGLIAPVLGPAAAKTLLQTLVAIETLADIRQLRPLLQCGRVRS